MDYANFEGPSAVIAMVKSPAKVSRLSNEYRGPILINPGLYIPRLSILMVNFDMSQAALVVPVSRM